MRGRPGGGPVGRLAVLLPVLVLACRKPAPPVAPAPAPVPSRIDTRPAGTVAGGVFEDVAGTFRLAVPEGWAAEPGVAGGALRVGMDHGATGARVEVWRFAGRDLRPRPRQGCLWTFTDQGPYRDLPVSDALVVATCMPEDPDAARVQAWLLQRGEAVWQLEVHMPGDQLLAARRAGLAVLATARWSESLD